MRQVNQYAPMKQSRVKSVLAVIVRVGVGAGLLGCLLWMNREQIATLRTQQIRWGFLLAAFVITLIGTLLTFFRWYLLVIAQGLAFRIRDSMRIGFIGYLFSQVIPGAVSGDLVKVVMLVREQERRTVAVATIIIDRVIGLYGLDLLTGLAALYSWHDLRQVAALRTVVVWLVALVVVGTAGFVLMFMPIF